MRPHMTATNKFTALLAALLLAGCTSQSQPAVAPTASAAPTVAPTAPPLTIKPTTIQSAPTSATTVVPTVAASEPQPTQAAAPTSATAAPALQEYQVPRGSHPHDVAPATDGAIWYTAQASGELGRLDPATGETRHIPLGDRSAPHGVIVGPDGAPWITDGGLNAIVRVDPATEQVQTFPLPADRAGANLNTAVFDKRGVLWFTGQTGIYGRLDPKIGTVEVFDAPHGRGPYGVTVTPDGTVYYASLAGSHIARLDPETGQATPIDPPTAGQGARRVWSDSRGRGGVSGWNA